VTPQLVQVPRREQGPASVRWVTEPNFELGKGTKGTKTAIDNIDESAKYSWVKSPRFKGQPMEVGPLARYVTYYAMGIPEFKEPVDMVLKKLDVPVAALFSTLGRTAARGLEASWSAHKMKYFFGKLMANIKSGNLAPANIDLWEPRTWPVDARGVGYCEAPRGALGHWIRIRNTKIDNYQCIVADHLERRPARPEEPDRRLRGFADEHQDGEPDEPLEILRARSTASIRAWPARPT